MRPANIQSPARRRLFFTNEHEIDASGDETNALFVKGLLDELAEGYKRKWGFDFDRGEPLQDSNFIYEQVPEERVPGFYRCYNMVSGPADAMPSPVNWVFPTQRGNPRMEDAENLNPLVPLEEMEESFVNDTTSSSSTSFSLDCSFCSHKQSHGPSEKHCPGSEDTSSTKVMEEKIACVDRSLPIGIKSVYGENKLSKRGVPKATYKTPRKQPKIAGRI